MAKPRVGWLIRWLMALGVLGAVVLVLALPKAVESFHAKYVGVDLSQGIGGIGRGNTYAQYLAAHADAQDGSADVQVPLEAFASLEGEAATATQDGVYTATDSLVAWKVDVPQAGFYTLRLDYLTVPSRGVAIERSILINGQLPFDGAERAVFNRLWTDGGAVRQDNQGNQIRPTQVEKHLWQQAYVKDAMGYDNKPYRFYFQQGENTLALQGVDEPMVIGGITLCTPLKSLSYGDYLASQPASAGSPLGYLQVIQGEDAALRSSPSLYARYDRSSPATEPYSMSRTVFNMIGGEAWNKAGDWIQWDFEVPEDGYYHITLKGRQNFARGTLSCRSVFLDGVVPFDALETVGFFYQNSWHMLTLGDEQGNPYRFYLSAGKHTIRLEANLGQMGPILQSMEESIYRLNQIYRKIMVLTGAKPDPNRDYNLARAYPDAIAAMDLESKMLYKLLDDVIAVTGQKSDRAAVAHMMAALLERFVDNPDRIPRSFTNFRDTITSLGTAMQNMAQTRLDIDMIIISGADAVLPKPSEGLFALLGHEIRSCFASYTVDYNALGNVYQGEGRDQVIEVWILTGRDQSTVLKTMVDDTFTPHTGIKVNVKLVNPNALLNAVMAGNGPDVVLSTDSWNPVNYALRNAVEDLTQFEGFDQVIAQFSQGAYAPLVFEGGVYGLPETQQCTVTYYRKDILADYGLEVPQTWDDLYAMLPTLQGASMSLGISYPEIINPNLATYYAMLYQNGGSVYNEAGTQTLIANEAGIQAFERYTSLYKDYGLPTIFDFVSRFRSGEMPIGIYDYATFNTLVVSAPEIRGLWDFTLVPGTWRTDDGGRQYLDRSTHSQGVSCMMIATDDQQLKENAWQFMRWWVGEEAQVRFGREIESVLGASGRYATANTRAFEQLAWSAKQVAIIREQMAWAVGFREVAGGYYTNRHMVNAVRKVVNDKTDERETLLTYVRTINEEIVKKRTEFGLPLE